MIEGVVILGLFGIFVVGGMWSEFMDYLRFRERERRKDDRQD